MKKNKSNPLNVNLCNNLIGKQEHLNFLQFQAEYGIAIRGGSIPVNSEPHTKRISSPVNLLNSQEINQLIFSETLLNN